MPLVRSAESVLVVVDTQPGFVDHPAMGDAERTTAAHTVERIAGERASDGGRSRRRDWSGAGVRDPEELEAADAPAAAVISP
jgi:hypothetical protein